MAEIIECPRCQRKLRMADSVLGETVICPACQLAFTAELPNPSAPPPPPRPRDDEPPMYRAVSEEPLPRRYDDDVAPRRRDRNDDDYSRRRDRYDDDDYPRRGRGQFDNYQRPHRGSQIQTLGILSLVLVCFTMPALILAIVTISMAVSDLSAMSRGDMDDSGRTQTKTGLICAISMLVLLGLAVFSCIGINILNDM